MCLLDEHLSSNHVIANEWRPAFAQIDWRPTGVVAHKRLPATDGTPRLRRQAVRSGPLPLVKVGWSTAAPSGQGHAVFARGRGL